MNDERSVLVAEDRFFAALSKNDLEALGNVIGDDCLLMGTPVRQ